MDDGTVFGGDELARRRWWGDFERSREDALYGLGDGDGEDPSSEGPEEDDSTVGRGRRSHGVTVRIRGLLDDRELSAAAVCEGSSVLPQAIIGLEVDVPEDFVGSPGGDNSERWFFCLRINPSISKWNGGDEVARFELWGYVEGEWRLEDRWGDDHVHPARPEPTDPLEDLTEALNYLPSDGADPDERNVVVFDAMRRLRGGGIEFM